MVTASGKPTYPRPITARVIRAAAKPLNYCVVGHQRSIPFSSRSIPPAIASIRLYVHRSDTEDSHAGLAGVRLHKGCCCTEGEKPSWSTLDFVGTDSVAMEDGPRDRMYQAIATASPMPSVAVSTIMSPSSLAKIVNSIAERMPCVQRARQKAAG